MSKTPSGTIIPSGEILLALLVFLLTTFLISSKVVVFDSGVVGSILIGIVFGWILAHTSFGTSWDYKAYVAVLGAVVGGAGVDYLLKTNNVGYFWTGIFLGFFVNVAIRFWLRHKGDTGIPPPLLQ